MSVQSRALHKMENAIQRAITYTHVIRGASDVRARLAQAATELSKIEKKWREQR